MAAASLGQVYFAALAEEYGGGQVAVKVRRPQVLEAVSLDLYLMRLVAVAVEDLPEVGVGCGGVGVGMVQGIVVQQHCKAHHA